MITLADGATAVQLPADMLWSDEFSWHPVEQTSEPSITGAIIVQVAARQAGRPITLQSGRNPFYAALTRDQVEQVSAWASVAGKQLSLTIRGVARDVMFRHHESAPMEAEMLMYHAAPTAGDYYICVIRLMEI